MPGAATSTVFAVYGLKGGEVVTVSTNYSSKLTNFEVNSTGNFTGTGDNRANASGVVYIKATIGAANTTVQDIIQTVGGSPEDSQITVNGALTTDPTTIRFVHKAEKLCMYEPSSKAASPNFTLRRKIGTADAIAWSGNTNCPALDKYTSSPTEKYIRVWRNGAELTKVPSSPSGAAQFMFTESSGQITFGETTKKDDIIKVTIQPGANLPEETISFTVTAATP